MPDKKLTDSEIVKALECCVKDDILEANNNACLECPMNDDNACTFNLRKHTLDLINRLQERIKKLEKVEHFADKTIATLQAENERLQSRNKFLEIEYKNQGNLFWARVETAKAEAYKKFAERLKSEIKALSDKHFKNREYNICEALETLNGRIGNLLKELVGDGDV